MGKRIIGPSPVSFVVPLFDPKLSRKVRLRNHDLLTALDVLTTGSYRRLPSFFEVMYPIYGFAANLTPLSSPTTYPRNRSTTSKFVK